MKTLFDVGESTSTVRYCRISSAIYCSRTCLLGGLFQEGGPLLENDAQTPEYRINGQVLSMTDETRDLGDIVRDDMCFSKHCSLLVRKANSGISNLFRR